ncbi:hypothetical protein GCM10011500_26750 [Mucilaginibacter rubeus]|nr:hypothetical protein GCM10011500_26750 [Mucilaginibacter rubeus]
MIKIVIGIYVDTVYMHTDNEVKNSDLYYGTKALYYSILFITKLDVEKYRLKIVTALVTFITPKGVAMIRPRGND